MDKNLKNVLFLYWSFILSVGLIIFFLSLFVKADCDVDPNMEQIKTTLRDIDNIYRHPSAVYLHLNNDDKKLIKKKMQTDPSLNIFLKMN